MKSNKIKKNPVQLQSLIGFTLQEFESFLPTFKYQWDEYYSCYTLKEKSGKEYPTGEKPACYH
jgi:hypothetical protein